MIVKNELIDLELDEDIIKSYNLKNIAYFDIEASKTQNGEEFLFAISIGRFLNNTYKVTQYFGEKINEEKKIIILSKKILENYNIWSTFNGLSFDEPFLIKRGKKYNVIIEKPKYHIDLYRKIKPYHNLLNVEGCGLKALEKGIGINREDSLNGYDSRLLYDKYLAIKDNNIALDLMRHNIEDVISLPSLFKYFSIIKDKNLVRNDLLTETQRKSINNLLSKRNIDLNIQYNNISKKCAGKIIYGLINKKLKEDDIETLIKNS